MAYQGQHIWTRVAATLAVAVLALFATKANAATVDACTQTTPLTGGTTYTSDGQDNNTGDNSHTLWHGGGNGSISMTNYGHDAAFKATWNNSASSGSNMDFLARQGFQWDETHTYDYYGNVTADYNFKTSNVSKTAYSYIGIYGWSNNPLVEYYIDENGFNGVPNAGALGGATSKGSFDIDGGTYDIYTYQRQNQPSIHGNATFMQYWSVRRTQRTCGHISLSEHWKKWASLNMTLGKMYEAKLLIEAGADLGGSGTFDMTYGVMKINVPTDGLVSPEPTPQLSRAGATSWTTGKSGTLSLVSLNGSVIRSVRQDASSPAVVPTTNLAKGVYLLRFQGEGSAPETRKFLLN